MDVEAFTAQLFLSLARNGLFQQVWIEIDELVVSGRIQISEARFLRFYFNSDTEVLAFALIESDERVWGIDRDNLRGWHIHPLASPSEHIPIEPLTVAGIIEQLAGVLADLA